MNGGKAGRKQILNYYPPTEGGEGSCGIHSDHGIKHYSLRHRYKVANLTLHR